MIRPELGALSPRIARLPIDTRSGYPIPWFVDRRENDEITGVDFRVVDRRKFVQAIKENRCWVCSEPLGHWKAFPIATMCAITRTISEPPCHRECAEWSIQNCPFLSNPAMVRRTDNIPPGAQEPAGACLMRNPGVMALWITRSFETFTVNRNSPVGNAGTLITIGEPADVTWWREGRPATRDEVQAAVESGLPNLLAMAKLEGPFAVEALGKQVKRAEALWPAPTMR
jgi:hypothetical protein